MQPITTQQLITESLNKLSSDLYSQMMQTLQQMEQKQQALIEKEMQTIAAELSTQLYQQLLTHLTQQVNQKTKTHDGQITQYLNELDKLQKSEIATLKKGQEEFQNLQDKIQSTLTRLDVIQIVDESEFEKSLTDLEASIKILQSSISQSNSEQQSLESLISELETLKTDLVDKVSELTKLQSDLTSYTMQLKQLLS